MRFTNRRNRAVAAFVLCLCFLTGCGNKNDYQMAYDADYPVSSFRILNTDQTKVADSFASDLCVTDRDVTEGVSVDLSSVGAAGLFDIQTAEVIYGRNLHEKLYPASLTKIMTALVALKYGYLDDVLTASENVEIDIYGAQLFGLKAGDQMTLNQALHLLLINSDNDVAVLIAEHIGGSVAGFAQMMNDEAAALGATNTHFVNPHGLSDDNHYTTAYDLYLMFNEVIKYPEFCQIIAMDGYTITYLHNGEQKEASVSTTNQYFMHNYTPPGNITILGGKTGTTNAAGNCLLLLVKDASGNQYISVILRARERSVLYEKMNGLLAEIYR